MGQGDRYPIVGSVFFESVVGGDFRPPAEQLPNIAQGLAGYMQANPDKAPDLLYTLLKRIADLEDKEKVLEAAANTDALTGAYARGHYQDVLANFDSSAWTVTVRKPTGRHYLAFVDLDDFKKINDTCGHDAGDEALIHLVKTIQETIRKTDDVCRIGGDEFAFILRDATEDGAVKKIVEVTDKLKNLTINYNGRPITFSATLAYGEIDPGPGRPMSVIKMEIDAKLYEAKRAKKVGRDMPNSGADTLPAHPKMVP